MGSATRMTPVRAGGEASGGAKGVEPIAVGFHLSRTAPERDGNALDVVLPERGARPCEFACCLGAELHHVVLFVAELEDPDVAGAEATRCFLSSREDGVVGGPSEVTVLVGFLVVAVTGCMFGSVSARVDVGGLEGVDHTVLHVSEITVVREVGDVEVGGVSVGGASVLGDHICLCKSAQEVVECVDRKSTRLNSSHSQQSRMPSSA